MQPSVSVQPTVSTRDDQLPQDPIMRTNTQDKPPIIQSKCVFDQIGQMGTFTLHTHQVYTWDVIVLPSNSLNSIHIQSVPPYY